jgi:hypothetical protein
MENRFSPDAKIGSNLDDMFAAFGLSKANANSMKTAAHTFQYFMDAFGVGESLGQNSSNNIDVFENDIRRSTALPVDSFCIIGCGGKPHDNLRYERIFPDNSRDTIDPKKKELHPFYKSLMRQ